MLTMECHVIAVYEFVTPCKAENGSNLARLLSNNLLGFLLGISDKATSQFAAILAADND